jgi:hypothetical protein
VSPGATRALRGRQESRAEGREALQHATVLARSADLSPALPERAVGARLRFFVLAWTFLVGDP